MAKKKIFIWLGSAFAVSLAYLFIAAKPITSEFTLQKEWSINLDEKNPPNDEVAANSDNLIPFFIGNHYGYIAPNGTLMAKKSIQNNQLISITPKIVSVWNPIPDTLTIESAVPDQTITIKDPMGYPYLVDDRIFLIGKDQDSVALINKGGNTEWSYAVGSPITALDCRADRLLIGTLDGTIYLLSLKGELLFTFQPGGSRLSVIAGGALSSDGNYIAVISGIDRQRFILLEKASQTYKVLHHQFLDSDFRRPVLVQFVQNNQYVLFEGKTNALVFDIHKRKIHEVPLNAPLLAIETIAQSNLVFMLTGKDLQKQLIVLRLPDRKLITAPFVSRESFIYTAGNHIILGSDSVIASYLVGK